MNAIRVEFFNKSLGHSLLKSVAPESIENFAKNSIFPGHYYNHLPKGKCSLPQNTLYSIASPSFLHWDSTLIYRKQEEDRAIK